MIAFAFRATVGLGLELG